MGCTWTQPWFRDPLIPAVPWLPGVALGVLQAQEGCGTVCEAEPCAPHAAAVPAQKTQGKSWCGFQLIFLSSSSSAVPG